jgi:hypothetical protein
MSRECPLQGDFMIQESNTETTRKKTILAPYKSILETQSCGLHSPSGILLRAVW